MRKALTAALAAASLVALAACNQEAAAADPIEGTWKADLDSSQYEDAPDTYLLQGGEYSCSTCNPPLTVAADGQFHAVADRPYYDSMSVAVVDDRTVKFARRKGDRDVGESTWQVSEDGNTLNVEFVDRSTANPVTGKGTNTRVAAAPAGAHAVSGSWKANRLDELSDEALTLSFDVEGDRLKSTSGDGTSYEATIGGADAPVQGDNSGLMVAVTRTSPNTIVETFKRDGKVVGVSTVTVGEDGRLSGVYENKVSGGTTRYSASKQAG